MQQQKAAALKAAARFATDADRATDLYAALTGQSARLNQGSRETLEEEMCSLLPAYRHPVHDPSTEYILFVDPAGLPPAAASENDPPGCAAPTHPKRGQQVYQTYLNLLRSRGLGRQEAMSAVRDLYGYADDSTTLCMLREQREEVLRRWHKAAPCLAETILGRLRRMFPGE